MHVGASHIIFLRQTESLRTRDAEWLQPLTFLGNHSEKLGVTFGAAHITAVRGGITI